MNVCLKSSIENAEHFIWGDLCDGWHLVDRDGLNIVQERVPPGKSEVRHFHNSARQYFFVLEGEATLDLGSEIVTLGKHEGLEVPPQTSHQFRNESDKDVVFLVISAPKSHGDRIEV
jgi:mannose-6-phosphate isomerase-like protein (cupin superfamily)